MLNEDEHLNSELHALLSLTNIQRLFFVLLFIGKAGVIRSIPIDKELARGFRIRACLPAASCDRVGDEEVHGQAKQQVLQVRLLQRNGAFRRRWPARALWDLPLLQQLLPKTGQSNTAFRQLLPPRSVPCTH